MEERAGRRQVGQLSGCRRGQGQRRRDRAYQRDSGERSATSSTATLCRPRCRWLRSGNKSGQYVKASLTSGKDALASVELPANLRTWITIPRARRPTRSSPTPGSFATKSNKDPPNRRHAQSVIDTASPRARRSASTSATSRCPECRERGQPGARRDLMTPSEAGASAQYLPLRRALRR